MSKKCQVSFVFDGTVLTLILKGDTHQVHKENPKYKKVRDGLQTMTEDQLLDILNTDEVEEVVNKTCANTALGDVKVVDGVVYHNNEVVEGQLASRVHRLVNEGLPVDGMLKFIARVYKNMSFRTRRELINFIERNGLTIDSEGCMLAYKAVNPDYTDKFSGKIDNSPGCEVKMDRAKVDDNFKQHCSAGLHAGDLRYIYWYGNGSDRIVVVKIDPEDVVCVPEDHECRKIRVCRYVVVGDYNGELKRDVYDASLSVPEMYRDECDEDEDDDDDHYGWCSDEDDDWDEDYEDDDYEEDTDEYEDDSFCCSDVTSTNLNECCNTVIVPEVSFNGDRDLGVKPSGHAFWNVRGPDGKFTTKG